MYAIDFEYDNRRLSDLGFIVCNFNYSSGAEMVSAGSKLTFHTVPRHKGKKYGLAGTQYDECIGGVFDICKNPDVYDDLAITDDEFKELIRWLNRREFLSLGFLNEENEVITQWYWASFNIDKIKISEVTYGLELTMTTDSPFAYGNVLTEVFDITDTSTSCVLIDDSEEIGFLYPEVAIECAADGDLRIVNEDSGSLTEIKNCSNGEIITLYGDAQIVSTSVDSHKIYNDFNFDFFKIANSIDNRENHITSTLPCTLTITYRPIIKDAP